METQLALLTHHPCCAWIPPPLQRADICSGWRPLLFSTRAAARVLVIRPFDGSAEKRSHSRGQRRKQGSSPSMTARPLMHKGSARVLSIRPLQGRGTNCQAGGGLAAVGLRFPSGAAAPGRWSPSARDSRPKARDPKQGVLHVLCSTPCFSSSYFTSLNTLLG